jgi:HK97 family phage portal protein
MGRLGEAWRALTSRDLSATDLIARERLGSMRGAVSVTQESALRNSAWWACLRLRGDLVSTTPVDAYRRRNGIQTEVVKPALLVEPAPGVDITEHLYSTQVDLDRYGTSVGIITARNSLGLPAAVELVPMSDTSAIMNGNRIREWRIGRDTYTPDEVWVERQFTVAGWPLGLSPLAYAAWTVGGYLSAQQFALDWFGSGVAPSGVLRNTVQASVRGVAPEIKAAFKAATQNRDIFVTGREWEWTPAATDAASTGFLESQRAGILDVCRYLGVPGDMIDAATESGSLTYANVTQRNVQLLVINLGPVFVRRERAWSRALPAGRFVKFNTDALLRMDPEARERTILARVQGRAIAPSEARELDNLPPYTDEQLAELAYFAQLGKPATPTSKQAGQGTGVWEVPA